MTLGLVDLEIGHFAANILPVTNALSADITYLSDGPPPGFVARSRSRVAATPIIKLPSTGHHQGLAAEDYEDILASWLIEAAESGNPNYLQFLLDTDGCQTYRPDTGWGFWANDRESRIHPWIARAEHVLKRMPGVALATSTGGQAERSTIVYEGSNLAGVVDGYCGYDTESFFWRPDGTFDIQFHEFSEHVVEFWELLRDLLNEDLRETFPLLREQPVSQLEPFAYPTSTENFDGNVVWFQNKGTIIALQERGSKVQLPDGNPAFPDFEAKMIESAERVLRSDRLQDWILSHAADPSWGPQNPEKRAELVTRLLNNLVTRPMAAGYEWKIDLGLSKGTVTVDRVEKDGAERIVSVSDDHGDLDGMEAADALRAAKVVDALLLAAGYPVDAEGHRPNTDVLTMSDFVLRGVPVLNEADRDFLRENIPVEEMTAAGRLGEFFTRSIIKAVTSRPDLFDADLLLGLLYTELDQMHALAPHPRGYTMESGAEPARIRPEGLVTEIEQVREL